MGRPLDPFWTLASSSVGGREQAPQACVCCGGEPGPDCAVAKIALGMGVDVGIGDMAFSFSSSCGTLD